MLAATYKVPTDLKAWPYLLSVKLDGFRCVVRDSVALTKNLKPIKNKFIQSKLGHKKYNGLDGELIVGAPTGGNVIGRTSSGVTSVNGEPDFTFWTFDDFLAHAHPFSYRIGRVEDRVEDAAQPWLQLVPHHRVDDDIEFNVFELAALDDGFEGVMVRRADGPYKHGRATELEDTLWKVKRFIDGEAVVTKLLQGQRNTNALEANAMGRAKRSTRKEGMVPNGKVGTILGRDLVTGDALEIAPGCMEEKDREHFWRHPRSLVGKIVKYKAFDYGLKDKLRHLTYQAIRHPDDLTRPGAL